MKRALTILFLLIAIALPLRAELRGPVTSRDIRVTWRYLWSADQWQGSSEAFRAKHRLTYRLGDRSCSTRFPQWIVINRQSGLPVKPPLTPPPF